MACNDSIRPASRAHSTFAWSRAAGQGQHLPVEGVIACIMWSAAPAITRLKSNISGVMSVLELAQGF